MYQQSVLSERYLRKMLLIDMMFSFRKHLKRKKLSNRFLFSNPTLRYLTKLASIAQVE